MWHVAYLEKLKFILSGDSEGCQRKRRLCSRFSVVQADLPVELCAIASWIVQEGSMMDKDAGLVPVWDLQCRLVLFLSKIMSSEANNCCV